MDKKITKYKLKKNNLEEKIINLLNLKKHYYENEIINSNNNQTITSEIENFFNFFDTNNSNDNNNDNNDNNYNNNNNYKCLMIFVFGSSFVGKTTFINHLVNYIKIMNYQTNNNAQTNKNNIDNLINKFTIKTNDECESAKNINFTNEKKIFIFECDINYIKQINSLFVHVDNKIINVNIIPKNEPLLKNKLINKIIFDIKNSTKIFNDFFLHNETINLNEKQEIMEKINLLSKKTTTFTDDDFSFLINFAYSYYHKILNDSTEFANLPNYIKYYL